MTGRWGPKNPQTFKTESSSNKQTTPWRSHQCHCFTPTELAELLTSSSEEQQSRRIWEPEGALPPEHRKCPLKTRSALGDRGYQSQSLFLTAENRRGRGGVQAARATVFNTRHCGYCAEHFQDTTSFCPWRLVLFLLTLLLSISPHLTTQRYLVTCLRAVVRQLRSYLQFAPRSDHKICALNFSTKIEVILK